MLDLQFYEPAHAEELELMCKYGFNINERLPKYNNQTPFSIFINKNYSISMFNVLIKNGARFDLQDNNGQTCLHFACQSAITDSVFEFIINNSPDSCLNIRNQLGSTPLDLAYLSTYEHASLSQMRRLHLLLSRKESKLTRYGIREPNLLSQKQYKLFNILACKEFLFKYRLKDIFDPSIRSLVWSIFLFYDVLRACEQRNTNLRQQTIQQRLDCYLISMIENGEISLDRLIFRPNPRLDNPFDSSSSNQSDEQILTYAQNSLLHMSQIKSKLSELRMQTLTLKVLCRIKIKKEIRTYPNDVVKLDSLSKILQAYLTFYNPFIKADVTD
jgi:ankyrin repeat protein